MSPVDLSSGKLSKYFFESFPCILFKEYMLSSGSHTGIHHTAANQLLTQVHEKEVTFKKIFASEARPKA